MPLVRVNKGANSCLIDTMISWSLLGQIKSNPEATSPEVGPQMDLCVCVIDVSQKRIISFNYFFQKHNTTANLF